MSNRTEPPTFRKESAPQNYVPGLGRGAIGFTTRSDIGPARYAADTGRGSSIGLTPNFGKAPEGYVAGAGRGTGGFGETKASAIDRDASDFRETNYDNFAGFSTNLFASSAYDNADKEADETWDLIDKQMENRKKKRKKVSDKEDSNTEPKKRVADQFADLKPSLGQVSFEAWDAIPESVTGIKAHKSHERFSHVSDSLIVESAGLTSTLNKERGRIIQDKLDHDSSHAHDIVDTDGYLASLADEVPTSMPVGDVKKARLLFKSVTSTNPTHGPGWIAAARLEEVSGHLLDARKIIEQGCHACPKNEQVWLEAARLNTPANAKIIMANAMQHLPKSETLWVRAADMEGDDIPRKRRVFRKALEEIPDSEVLWKAAVELEDNPQDVKILLQRAVECVPQCVDMWLALAQMETYDVAKVVLNKARKTLPTEVRIWVAACTLEEAQCSENLDAKLDTILSKAVKQLSQPPNCVVDRTQWLELARTTKDLGQKATCYSIVRNALRVGIAETDTQRTFLEDAAHCIREENYEVARAIYSVCLKEFHGNKKILMHAVAFEKKHGTQSDLQALLQRAVRECPETQFFWLLAAKEMWKELDDVEGARKVLSDAFEAGHNSEEVWLAAVKLEWETGEIGRARALLQKARQQCPSSRIWVKSVLLERVERTRGHSTTITPEDHEALQSLLQSACKNYPEEPKLWLMFGQLEEAFPHPEAAANARNKYLEGLRHCPHSVPLWLSSANLELTHASIVKARSVLELGRLKNPDSDVLWLASIRLERDHKTTMLAPVVANAIKACPKSGLLWADMILHAPKPKQRSTSLDAMQNCEENAHVFVALGIMFAKDKKLKQAKKWFDKAIEKDPSLGDAWAHYIYFEMCVENDTNAANDLVIKCRKAEPRYGEIWQKIAKQDENRFLSLDNLVNIALQEIRHRFYNDTLY